MTGKLYEGGFAGCLGYLSKRVILLGAKLVGFKGFCLFLGTLLLFMGRIGEDVWLTLAVTLVCSASGIRVLDSLREGTDALDAKNALSGRLLGRAGRKGMTEDEDEHEGSWKGASGGIAGGPAFALPGPGGAGARADGGAGNPGDAGAGEASGAARRAAGRKAGKATRRAAGGLGEKGRERIRAVLEEAARCVE